MNNTHKQQEYTPEDRILNIEYRILLNKIKATYNIQPSTFAAMNGGHSPP